MSRKDHVVFIRDFPLTTTDADIPKFFAPLKVIKCNVVRDQVTRASKGFGFAYFASEEDQKTALAMNGKTLANGQKLTVRPREQPASAPVHQAPPKREKPAKAVAASDDDWNLPANIIAVYFGTFDPVHNNHIALALHTITAHRATEVVFVPNTDNAFKPFVTSLNDRLAMLEARVSIENSTPRGKILRVYHPRAGQALNWHGRAEVCQELRREWTPKSSSVKIIQIMGQDSFEEATAQKALSMKHVRDSLDRTLLVFPRLGCADKIRVPGYLSPHVQIAQYEDADEFSSTEARQELYDNEQPECVHDVVYEVIKQKKLYQKISPHASITLVTLIGGPGCGKGSLAARLAASHQFVPFSCGDCYRANLTQPAFAEINERLRHSSAALWGQLLEHCSHMCLKRAIEVSKGTRFVLDGYDETNMLALEAIFDGACVDLIINMKCSPKALTERLSLRGREAADEISRRVDKFVQNVEVHDKQIKSFQSSGRDVDILDIDVDVPIDEYLASSDLLSTITEILAKKQVSSEAASLVLPEHFIEEVAAHVCSTSEFTELVARLSEELAKIKPVAQESAAEEASEAASEPVPAE